MDENKKAGLNEKQIIAAYYTANKKQVQKALFYMKICPGETYKDIQDQPDA